MQEIRMDGTEVLTPDVETQAILKAMVDPRNKEVRLIPDMSKPAEFYIVKKRGKWVKRRK